MYGSAVSLWLDDLLRYGPSVLISGTEPITLFSVCLNLYRCTSGVWLYRVGVLFTTAVLRVSEFIIWVSEIIAVVTACVACLNLYFRCLNLHCSTLAPEGPRNSVAPVNEVLSSRSLSWSKVERRINGPCQYRNSK